MPDTIGWVSVAGTPFDVGYAAGCYGRAAVHEHLLSSSIWANTQDAKHKSTVDRLITSTQQRFPHVWHELQGLAKGLELPLEDVVAWNCRGDILASTPDGCSTVIQPGPPITISHNEDGLPFFGGHCFFLNASPDNQIAFHAFCYPGSIAGHTFGWNDAGLAQAVNNLRLHDVSPDIPRMVVARSIIASESIDEALSILANNCNSGGFHMTLAQTNYNQVTSAEYGDGKLSTRLITERCAHTNHTLHMQHPHQTATPSSRDRQHRLQRLIKESALSELEMLRDTLGPGLPVHRKDANDPDDENTLVTCIITITRQGIQWQLFDE